jgi:trehalose synthase
VIQNINSTFSGGGVAEILNRMIPLLEQLGVDARWNVIKGSDPFYQVTKKFHNALHGRPQDIDAQDYELFLETTQFNLKEMNLYGDIFFVHDPQPAGLIQAKKEIGKKWIWRCHIDISQPNQEVWNFLRPFI